MATRDPVAKRNRYGIAEARAHLGELVDRVRFTGERIILEKSGKAVAVIQPATAEDENTQPSPANRWLTPTGEVRELADGEFESLSEDEQMEWIVEVVHEVRRLTAEGKL